MMRPKGGNAMNRKLAREAIIKIRMGIILVGERIFLRREPCFLGGCLPGSLSDLRPD